MSEQLVIDHEAIRAIGATMAQHIGALSANGVDHQASIDALNMYADQVPYAMLFSEHSRVSDSLSVIQSARQAIDEKLEVERQRLDSLVATFATKRPAQVEAATKLSATKKEEAAAAAAAEKQPLEEPFVSLSAELAQVTETIESVATAWPTPPFSEEDLKIFEDRQAEIEDDGEDLVDLEAARKITPRIRPELVEKREPGPYADLAVSIPNLDERLSHPVSKHLHVHGEIETAKASLDKATAKPQAERNEEEDNLCKAVFVLRRRFLADPNDLSFLKVYEASDVIDLAQRLNKFRSKNRPDFDQLEGRILDKAAARIPLRGGNNLPADLEDAIDRMQRDIPGRTGMTWHSLAKHANRACDTMRHRMLAGGVKNEHLKNYIIEVVDGSGTKPNISWIYQYIADEFAFDVIARRTGSSQITAKERFAENCEKINQWLEESRDLLDQLPEGFRLKRPEDKNPRRRYRVRGDKKTVYENASARTSVLNMIQDIMIRRDGTGDGKVFRHKPVDLDPNGALNHQLRLGHIINALKEELTYYAAVGEGYTEEITPFE